MLDSQVGFSFGTPYSWNGINNVRLIHGSRIIGSVRGYKSGRSGEWKYSMVDEGGRGEEFAVV